MLVMSVLVAPESSTPFSGGGYKDYESNCNDFLVYSLSPAFVRFDPQVCLLPSRFFVLYWVANLLWPVAGVGQL